MNLLGQMAKVPMLLSSIIQAAARQYAEVEIVSRRVEGDTHRYTYKDCHVRCMKLANSLLERGIQSGDRIATLAWNGYRHIELYYAISGIGAVCHTINPRLYPEQITYIINHSGDRYVFFDSTFAPLVEQIAPQCPNVERWVMLCSEDALPSASSMQFESYERMIGGAAAEFAWPRFDEECAAILCYTSGTTGDPKGVLYSHRSLSLMAYASALPDALSLSTTDTVAPLVPMFHVNAWGLPFSAPLVGAKLVLAGAKLDGKSLYTLFSEEGVTMSAGVPTVWNSFVQYLQNTGERCKSLTRAVVGGAACPPSLATSANEVGIRVLHGWGMTETSPLGTVCTPSRAYSKKSLEEQSLTNSKQGRAVPGIELKIVGLDGAELPRDGQSSGELMVRGHWVVERYFGASVSALKDGWFATGDIATIDSEGFLHITDRSKDVIKSGGEWISSIELENIASSHPEIRAAACIGRAHPKWGERPILIVVRVEGGTVSAAQLLDFFEGKIAKWSVPDCVEFVDSLPFTATGKVNKVALRQRFSVADLCGGSGR